MNKNDVVYKVIPEHGVVIAEIDGTRYNAIEVFNRKFVEHATSSLCVDYQKWGDERFFMPDAFKAVARCHPNDTFDVERGKRIAYDKLVENYQHSLNKHLNNINKALIKATLRCEEYLFERMGDEN